MAIPPIVGGFRHVSRRTLAWRLPSPFSVNTDILVSPSQMLTTPTCACRPSVIV